MFQFLKLLKKVILVLTLVGSDWLCLPSSQHVPKRGVLKVPKLSQLAGFDTEDL